MPAPLNFKEIAETVDIALVAEHNGVRLRNNRAKCPACNGSDDRSLELIPDTNTFRCWASGKKAITGDNIALHAHLNGYQGMYRAAKELSELFLGTAPRTAPQEQEGRKNLPTKPSKEAPFDPAAFLEKLEYSDDVKATGLSEDDAKALGVGTYRGKLYQALRYPSGSIAGFSYVEGGKLRPPKNLLPDNPVVVPFKKRA